MAISVRVECPHQEEIASLLRQSDALAAALYPGEHRRALNPDMLSVPGISLFAARIDEPTVAGCCALLDGLDGTAELKRMFVDPNQRGQGVGNALLQAIDDQAVKQGIDLIRMEVGIGNTDGQAFYRRAGYVERGPFGRYKPSPISRFFEKRTGPGSDG